MNRSADVRAGDTSNRRNKDRSCDVRADDISNRRKKDRSGDVRADDDSTRRKKDQSGVFLSGDVSVIVEDQRRSVSKGMNPVVATTPTVAATASLARFSNDLNDVDDDYSIDAFSRNSAVRTPDITWTPVGTPVPYDRRVSSRPRVAAGVVGDEVELKMERFDATPATDDNSCAAVGSVITACGIDRTIPFFSRYFAPHVEVEASLMPVKDQRRQQAIVEAVPPPIQEKWGGDRIERRDRSRVTNHAAYDNDIPPARTDESNDLVLTPKILRSLSNSIGRFAARGRGRLVAEDQVHPPLVDVTAPRVEIREIREVASDITMPPTMSMDSPNRAYRSPSSLAMRSRTRRGSKRLPVRGPPRPKVDEGAHKEMDDCARRLEVCADGGDVEVYDASKFCTGDMTNFFPVDWGFEK